MSAEPPNPPADNLGHLLLLQRKINPDQITEAVRRQTKSGRRMGTELIGMGIPAADVVQALRMQGQLRGEPIDEMELAQKLINDMSFRHFRTQQKQALVREAAEKL